MIHHTGKIKMAELMTAEFGTWDSPIDASMVAQDNIAFQDLVLDNNNIYWSEMRPPENGRYVIVKQSNDSSNQDMLPQDYNARNRVHEYGGASFIVKNDIIYFINYKDQKIYEIKPNEKPRAITPKGTRFADMHITPFGIVAIAESHSKNIPPENYIAHIDIHSGKISRITSGYDFYAGIAISHDYKNIAWICWNQPNMPWDNNELWTAKFSDNGITTPQQVDPNTSEQSFFQPQWRHDNQLFVVSDKSNWWNLYSVNNSKITPVFEIESEIGLPQWVFNMSTWGFYNNKIVCSFSDKGVGKLFEYDAGKLSEIKLPFTSYSQIRANNNHLAMLAGSTNKSTVLINLDRQYKHKILQTSSELQVTTDYLSQPDHIQFDTTDGRQAYAYFYPPKNKQYQGIAGSLPPLIVQSHGGPTANTNTNLNLKIQYWTSRGFAFADVNYAGSTGYGREYRKSLEGKWGIYDIDDCSAVAKYLSQHHKVDKNKLAITGGSAGGYTTLAALTFTDTFHVGASHYGVSDLEALAKETHKFEAKYLDKLIGFYPKEKSLYQARAPICHIDKLSAPVIFFQGAEDKIVPPSQAEAMYLALKEKNIKTSYFLFPGEQHGFRKSENIMTALEEQRKFFISVLLE